MGQTLHPCLSVRLEHPGQLEALLLLLHCLSKPKPSLSRPASADSLTFLNQAVSSVITSPPDPPLPRRQLCSTLVSAEN